MDPSVSMSADPASELTFEIGHVLFIDIVCYSKLLINEQSEQIQELREIVRGTEQFRSAEAKGNLMRDPASCHPPRLGYRESAPNHFRKAECDAPEQPRAHRAGPAKIPLLRSSRERFF